MNRGRSDINEKLRHNRITGGAVFHGNSTVVNRACDRFFMERGIVIDGLRGLMTREVRMHKQGRKIREDKTDQIASELESEWQA